MVETLVSGEFVRKSICGVLHRGDDKAWGIVAGSYLGDRRGAGQEAGIEGSADVT